MHVGGRTRQEDKFEMSKKEKCISLKIIEELPKRRNL
jgi:hypothetical protein